MVVREAPRMLQALIELCTSQRGWLQPVLAAIELSQCVVQRICPWDSQRGRDLRQLPHIGAAEVKYCTTKTNKVYTTKQFLAKTTEERRAILRKVGDEEFEHIEAACAVMPHFDIEYQAFVKGDDDDVADTLYGLCKEKEEELHPKVAGDEAYADSGDEDDDWAIPEDDEDDGPKYLPWTAINDILLTAGDGYDWEFTPKKIHDAREEMGEEDPERPGELDYTKFVKIAAKQVLKIHAMDLVTIRLDLKMHNPDVATEEVHCPEYPSRKRCAWFAILADPNHNTIMDFKRVGNIATSKQESRNLMWMPQKAGKYELEVHLKTDSYGGLDIKFPMRLDVLKKKEIAAPTIDQDDINSDGSESDDSDYDEDDDLTDDDSGSEDFDSD